MGWLGNLIHGKSAEDKASIRREREAQKMEAKRDRELRNIDNDRIRREEEQLRLERERNATWRNQMDDWRN